MHGTKNAMHELWHVKIPLILSTPPFLRRGTWVVILWESISPFDHRVTLILRIQSLDSLNSYKFTRPFEMWLSVIKVLFFRDKIPLFLTTFTGETLRRAGIQSTHKNWQVLLSVDAAWRVNVGVRVLCDGLFDATKSGNIVSPSSCCVQIERN